VQSAGAPTTIATSAATTTSGGAAEGEINDF